VVILQDNAYGMIRWKQAADGYLDFGMTFGNPDFVAYAKSYGINGSRVDSAEGLVPTLEAAFAAGGVQLNSSPLANRGAALWGSHKRLRRPLTEIGQDLPPCDEQAPLLQCDHPRVRCSPQLIAPIRFAYPSEAAIR
jgi:hypothetical protein